MHNIVLDATRLIAKFQAVQDNPKLLAIPPHTRWKPPMPGVYKANVDGAVFKDQLTTGLGMIICGAVDQVVGALSQQIYAPLSALEAEAKAMEAAMIFARDVGIQEVIFERDSLQVYNCLKGCSLVPLAVGNVLECILYHFQAFRSFDFSDIKRVDNRPTHLLAHYAKSVVDFEAWVKETPSFLEAALASDVVACST